MERKTVSSTWRKAALILGFFVAILAWERHQTRRLLNDVFDYHYVVTVVDADTGTILKPHVAAPPTTSKDLIRQSSLTITRGDGTMTLTGVAYTPRSYQFSMEGYEPGTLELSPGSPSYDEVRIKLKPRAPEKSGEPTEP